MRLPVSAHANRPWRIHQIAPDFVVEDVWALPTPGGPDDFPKLIREFTTGDPAKSWTGIPRLLWDVRWRLGALLGWDRPETAVGSRVPSLRDRLPADLRDRPAGPEFDALPFSPVYLTDDEWVSEIANQTVHALMHVGWVPDNDGFRGQLAVLVKPNGLLGTAYLAGIAPLRHLVVYPTLLGNIERGWRKWPG